MAFTRSEMALVSYNGAAVTGQKLIMYANTAGDDVTAANFFDDYADQLVEKDVILDANGAVFYSVSGITDGVVTVAAMFNPPV